MNSDKAYLLGLVIGGGVWGNSEDIFKIRLPYRQWGSFSAHPERAGQISRDILSVVSPMFKNIYGLNISFEASESEWRILCEGNTADLVGELASYGIQAVGEMRTTADITKLVAALVDDNLKRRFVAGLADTIGSTAKSHRRFSDDRQIISFELKGFNFFFVCSLCKLLHSINCFPDQVLWNHPNFHAAKNPYYKSWTKGFKLRVALDQFTQYGAFAFGSRAESAMDNLQLQSHIHYSVPCAEQTMSVTQTCVHPAECDVRLPPEIRDGHYLHNRHVCTVLKCEHAPYKQVKSLFEHIGDYINPFPILYKDKASSIERVIDEKPLWASRKYKIFKERIDFYLKTLEEDQTNLLYGTTENNGYPVTDIAQAIAYIIADVNELKNTRVCGGYLELLKKHLRFVPDLTVEIRCPDLLTPLAIFGNGRGALVGPKNPKVYSRLVSVAPDNAYKLLVREITEDDLRNA